MKQTWKRIGSLILSVCMAFTLLPTMAISEAQDSGTPLGMSGTITAFTELDTAVSAQSVEFGTTKETLVLPDEPAVTVVTDSAASATDSAEGCDPAATRTATVIVSSSGDSSTSITTETELKDALESTTPNSNIQLVNDITMNTDDIELGADHTLNTDGKTLTITGNKSIITWLKTLTINGGGTVNIANTASPAKAGIREYLTSGVEGTLNLESITVNLKNVSNYNGYSLSNLNITLGNGAIINVESPTARGILINEDQTLTINKGGTVNVKDFRQMGIFLENKGALHLNGGTLTFGAGQDESSGLVCNTSSLFKYTSGELTADAGASIDLRQASKAEGMNGHFMDRGVEFTGTGPIVVKAGFEAASASDLTHGLYFWNNTSGKFERNVITVITQPPQYVTVTQGAISAILTTAGTTSNGNTVMYQWYNWKPFMPIDGETNSSFSIPTDLIKGSYNCYCRLVAESCDSAATNIVYVTVNSPDDTTLTEITGLAAIPNVDAGKAGSSSYVDAAAVIAYLKTNHSTVMATYGSGSTVAWPVTTWVNTDGYNPAVAGSYTFTTMLGAAPPTFANSTGHKATVEVVVAPADSGEGVTTYSVSVSDGTGGGNYAPGAPVTITANTAPSGQRFKEWTLTPSVTFTDGTDKNSQTAKFTMPGETVTATAIYEAIPTGTVSVTGVSLNKSALSLYSNTTPNTATLIATVTPNDATNKAVTWDSGNVAIATVDQSGNIRAVSNGTAVITATTTDGGYTASCTVTATTYSSGGDSSSDSSTTTPTTTTPTTTTPENRPNQPATASAPVAAAASTNSTASAAITDQTITDAIAKAQADAKAQGKTANGISVALSITMPTGATSLTAALTQNSLNSLVNAEVTSFEINGAPVSLGLDLAALKEIQKQSGGNISISIAPATGLSNEAKALIGNRPVYNITISALKDGKTTNVTSLGNGTATLSIPYTPGKNEAVGSLFGVYMDGAGKVQRIPGSAYNTNSRSLLIPTGHFLVYGVGYTTPSVKFTDIGTHWGKEAIDYVVGRGLLYGTSETTFAPNTAMTWGMLVTALGRLAGVDVKTYTTNSFTDVKADSTFRPYIEWAYQKGVVQGIGNQQFAPDRAITREEIAVIFANYAKATGYKLPVIREATTYADASGIGSVYKTAVTAMQQAGIMMGGTDNKFNQKSSATRAEVSSMLHRYIKLTIDPATAQGWALNDAGQYLCYKDSKALTGIQTLDGTKYFFNTDGTLRTGWVKDGGNWRYYSGNKMSTGWWDIGSDAAKKTYYFEANGNMISGKWLQIDSKWYYFFADGSLAKNTTIDGHEVDDYGVRKNK